MKAIIIGSHHHNTLGLIRSLGRNGVKPDVLFVNNSGKDDYCQKSKYVKRYITVKTYDEALSHLILGTFLDDNCHPVLFPSSDGAEYMLDINMYMLKNKYVVPGINNKQGEVAKLMNKAVQNLWAQSLGIQTAKTYLVDLQDVIAGGGNSLCSKACFESSRQQK